MNKIKQEKELYEPLRLWLFQYLSDKFPGDEVIAIDAHAVSLDRALREHDIELEIAIGLDIQIDVLGVVKRKRDTELVFIEAKKDSLTLKDLGQLWTYCKLINPYEAFLITSKDFGQLNKILIVNKREDLLIYGNGKRLKMMKVCIWDEFTKSPDTKSMVPKIIAH
ncbi:MAG: hypothetical protein PHC50_07970 [Candidatus Cloacimonetes bacterium]|nr:hypothetical protein [Candidatus Cloacimonadota bacterium]